MRRRSPGSRRRVLTGVAAVAAAVSGTGPADQRLPGGPGERQPRRTGREEAAGSGHRRRLLDEQRLDTRGRRDRRGSRRSCSWSTGPDGGRARRDGAESGTLTVPGAVMALEPPRS
ncbi:hypothetical protein ACN6K9_004465 [Streptomyces sp. SAS_267]|uniref:hypothetical protein n=1 Tax=unclassified Streptomyces TaxID=2593676 RepID=UPI0036FF1463